MVYRRVAIIVIAIVAVFFGGTVGYMVIEGWSFNEAVYMTIITVSTVGYGEVRPLSEGGRIFTAALIVSGILLIATGANFIFSSIIEGTFGEILRRQGMQQKISKMNNHFVICGIGAVGEDIIHEFISANEPFVLIDREQEVLVALTREHPKVLYVTGDATHDDVLKHAGINNAKGIIAALGNDADNLYICLTARSLNPRLRIISRAVDAGSIDKLRKAGADYVFSPEIIGGIHLAAAALRPTVMSFLDTILRGQHLNLLLDEVTVKTGSSLAGKTLKETEISKKIGIVIPALKSAELNQLTFNPSSDSVINVGDTLIGFGTPEQMVQLRKICS